MSSASLGPQMPFEPTSLPQGPTSPRKGQSLSSFLQSDYLLDLQVGADSKINCALLPQGPHSPYNTLKDAAVLEHGEQKTLLELAARLFHPNPSQQISTDEFLKAVIHLNPHRALELLQTKGAEKLFSPEKTHILVLQQAFATQDADLLAKTLVSAHAHHMMGKVMHEAFQCANEKSYALISQAKDLVKESSPFVFKYLEAIIAYSKAIQSIASEHHNLSPLQTIQLSLFVQNELEKGAHRQDVAYFSRTTESKKSPVASSVKEQTPRTVVIDFKNKSFVILSKAHGVKGGEGATKKASDAVHVQGVFEHTPISAERKIRLVNKSKSEGSVTAREIEYNRKFNPDSLLVVPHTSKTGAAKISLIEKAYESDLNACRGNLRLNSGDIQRVFLGAAITLFKMHAEGLVHYDVKSGNILVRTDPKDGSKRAKLTDFGLSHDPKIERVQNIYEYGTMRYTAPETLDEALRPIDRVKYGKGIDMFALGCALYEVVSDKPIPWERDMNPDALFDEMLRAQEIGYEVIVQEAKNADNDKKPFFELIIALLNPEPEKRIPIEECIIRLCAIEPEIAAQILVETDFIHDLAEKHPQFFKLLTSNKRFYNKVYELLSE